MGKKLFGKSGVFAEVFGGGRVTKRKASAAGFALEEWGKHHHKRKRKAKKSRAKHPRKKLHGAALKAWAKKRGIAMSHAMKSSRKRSRKRKGKR